MKTIRHPRTHQHVKAISFPTEKGGERVEVTAPLLRNLQQSLEAGPCGDLAFIVGDRGQPLTKESFGNMFREAARKAGVNKSAHGVRKIAATRAAEAGCTTHELMSLFGWVTVQMAERYTRSASRKILPLGASEKLLGVQELPQRNFLTGMSADLAIFSDTYFFNGAVEKGITIGKFQRVSLG
jgi:integrase